MLLIPLPHITCEKWFHYDSKISEKLKTLIVILI